MSVSAIVCNTSQPDTPPSTVVTSCILSRLRLETRDEHDSVEKVLDLMSPSLTLDGYRQRLTQFYGFYAPLEEILKDISKHQSQKADETGMSRYTREAMTMRLNKTALLRRDLCYLGAEIENLPFCSSLPSTETQAEVLGCVYVMEGATLGGRLITQHVHTTLGITPTTGGSFFDGYGHETGVMWQAMRQILVKSASDTDTEDTLVASAIATFAGLRRWCESTKQQTTTEAIRHA